MQQSNPPHFFVAENQSEPNDLIDDLLLGAPTQGSSNPNYCSQGSYFISSAPNSAKREDSIVQNKNNLEPQTQISTVVKKGNPVKQSQDFTQQLKNLEYYYHHKVHSLEVQNLQLQDEIKFLKQQHYQIEFECQKRLRAYQKKHEDIIQLIKQKYHMVIERLRQKIKRQNDRYEKLISKVYPKQDITESLSILRSPLQKSHRDLDSQQNVDSDNKLIHLYQTEIDKLKKETHQNEMKFFLEKKQIIQEIEKMQTQKSTLECIIGRRSYRSPRRVDVAANFFCKRSASCAKNKC